MLNFGEGLHGEHYLTFSFSFPLSGFVFNCSALSFVEAPHSDTARQMASPQGHLMNDAIGDEG